MADKIKKRHRGSPGWALLLAWLSTLLLTALALLLTLLTTICSENFMRKQVARSHFADYAYSYLYDNFVSYGSSTGFEEDVITSTISREQINVDMEQAVTDLYAGNTAVNARENVKSEINDVLLADLTSRGKDVTEDVSSAVEIVADACRLDYANYVAIPLASQLYTVITKIERLLLPGMVGTAVLCAAALFLMIRLAGGSRFGVRCLTFTFLASALLCTLGATVLYTLLGLDNFSLEPASIRALVLTYLQNMFGSLGIFAAIYALIALILLALMFTAHHQLKRHYKQKP